MLTYADVCGRMLTYALHTTLDLAVANATLICATRARAITMKDTSTLETDMRAGGSWTWYSIYSIYLQKYKSLDADAEGAARI